MMEKAYKKKPADNSNRICVRLPKELVQRFNNYKKIHQINQNSTVILEALTLLLNVETTDENIILYRLNTIDLKLERIEVLNSWFINMFGFYMRHWYAHTVELPDDELLKATIFEKATDRFEKFLKAFDKNQKSGSNLISRFIAEIGLSESNNSPSKDQL